MSNPIISVIIPVFNLWALTKDCLISLAEHSPKHLLEIIVINNGSTDETKTELSNFGQGLFTNFCVINNEKNQGFAIACNQGARTASGKFLFFLNNDTRVTPNWLLPLLEVFSSPQYNDGKLAGLGPLLLYPEGRVQHCGVAFSYSGVSHLYSHFLPSHPAVQKHRKLQAITAAALLMPKDIFESANGFCELYRNGYEDIDLCLHLHHQGYYFACTPDSKIIHYESQSLGRKDYDAHNTQILAKRVGDNFMADLHLLGAQDEFYCVLDEAAKFNLRLHPRDEAKLNKTYAKESSIATLQEVLDANPLWYNGYDILGEVLKHNAEFEPLLHLRLLQCSFFKNISSYTALEEIARKLNMADITAQAKQYKENCAKTLQDKNGLLHRVNQGLRQARAKKQADIENMYQDWLKKYS